MFSRVWTAAILLVVTAFAAGCTGSDDGGAATTPRDAAPSAPGSGGASPGSGSSAPPPAAMARPAPVPTADAGAISGAFDKSWPVEVPAVGARGLNLHFNLTGVEAGAPVTAHVTLRLLDPAGNLLQAGTAGLGGDGDALHWVVQGASLPGAGTYTLTATAEAPNGAVLLPSAGLANYALYAYAEY